MEGRRLNEIGYHKRASGRVECGRMYGINQQWILEKLIAAPGLLFSLTAHEFAHARVALAFGDPTAKMMGRVSLNPLRHLDPIGTLALFFVGFGWAKPVPVNPANLHPQRMGDICVSLAGVAVNLLLAVIFGLLARAIYPLAGHMDRRTWELLMMAVAYTGVVNVALCVFNLIPLYPLDGHHVAAQMVDPWRRPDFMRWQMQYGMVVLAALLFGPGLLSSMTGGRAPDPVGAALGWAMHKYLWLFGLVPA